MSPGEAVENRKGRKMASKSLKIAKMVDSRIVEKFCYEVAVADSYGFDFGGLALARTATLGDAYIIAKMYRERDNHAGREIRVWNFAKSKQEYLLPVGEAVS